ncbi:hypothetical protein [Alienimonas californiensis]|uniref:Uncharacterized protein n=1 Tax=Alienimonas californiensis TaxID=2527989 RepID=A0A517PEZ6_9PLAN|nr:hypothetical protein [Alienimonas californiensis]QDT17934.1 hypothetical protein CA12_40720 [Alienimonas californiensis]
MPALSAPRSGARRPVARGAGGARPAGSTRSLFPSPGEERRVDFITFVAAKLNATPAEVATARDAARAMRAKLDGLKAAPARTAAAPRRSDGRLPFPPFDAPTPAVAPADAAADRRYTRTAA